MGFLSSAFKSLGANSQPKIGGVSVAQTSGAGVTMAMPTAKTSTSAATTPGSTGAGSTGAGINYSGGNAIPSAPSYQPPSTGRVEQSAPSRPAQSTSMGGGMFSQAATSNPAPAPTPTPTVARAAPPERLAIPSVANYEPRNVGVAVSAPETRKYDAFEADKSLDQRATDFKMSSDSMVEDRLTGLLSGNSDYLKRAQGTAAVAANRRGMLNSSMAAGAGTAAAIDAALPIAQQDASTHAQSELTKQGYFNNTSLADQQAVNTSKLSAQDSTQRSGEIQQQFQGTSELANQQGQLTSNLSAQEATQQAGLQASQAGYQSALQAQGAAENSQAAEQQFQFQKTLQSMDESSRMELLGVQQQHAMLLQQSQSAANRFQDLAQQISSISTSPDMNPEQKAAAINQLMALSNKSLATQSELMKAAGINGVEISPEDSATATPSLPSTPADQQLSFDASKYDKGNLQALRDEASRLTELANKLPANTPEGIKARQSLVAANLKDLEIQYYSTTSANAQRQIRGEMERRQAELNALNAQAGKLATATPTPATSSVVTGTAAPPKSQQEISAEQFSIAAPQILNQMGRFF